MEYLAIALFLFTLIVSIFLELGLLYPLIIGYIIFFLYAMHKGCQAKELLALSYDSVKNIGSLLALFCLIGILTASWRASGAIAFLAVKSSAMLIPSLFLLGTFLLCSLVSFLTGTSLGSSASIGLVCMTMGNVLGINPAYLGGAILSGSFFGDRMSPMSSSAHLLAKVTQTDIFVNIKNMFSSCKMPFIVSCLIYLAMGFESSENTVPYDTLGLFEKTFDLSWETLIPVIIVVVLASFRVAIAKIMLLSVISASFVCLFIQNMSLGELLKMFCFGYENSNEEIQKIMGGGGFISMISSSCIVAIASSYMGIFRASGFFDSMHDNIAKVSERMTVFGATSSIAMMCCITTCTQTLSIFLTKSLCEKLYTKNEKLAHAIEDSAIVFCGLVPWNLACSMPLANVNAPDSSIFYACFLYLIPFFSFFRFKKEEL